MRRIIAGFFLLDIYLFAHFLFPVAHQATAPALGSLSYGWFAVALLPVIGFVPAARRVFGWTAMPGAPQLGLPWTGTGARHFGLGMLLGSALMGMIILLAIPVAGLRMSVPEPAGSWLLPFLLISLLWFVISLIEEVVIRRYVLQHLLARFTVPTAVLLSSLIYVGHHYHHWLDKGPGPWIVSLFLQGIAYGVATVRTGSLWLATGIHTAWNIGVTLFFGFMSERFLVAASANPGAYRLLDWGLNFVLVLALVLWPARQNAKNLPTREVDSQRAG